MALSPASPVSTLVQSCSHYVSSPSYNHFVTHCSLYLISKRPWVVLCEIYASYVSFFFSFLRSERGKREEGGGGGGGSTGNLTAEDPQTESTTRYTHAHVHTHTHTHTLECTLQDMNAFTKTPLAAHVDSIIDNLSFSHYCT